MTELMDIFKMLSKLLYPSVNSLWFLLKRGAFWDPKNQCFLRNRGLFKVKVSEKGVIYNFP